MSQPIRWTSFAPDPMHPTALEHRRRIVDAARAPAVASRNDYILEACRDRTVLDVGVVDHTDQSDRQAQWLHGEIARVAKSVIGVDILPGEVEKLVSRGFNVLCQDITQEPLDEQFDVIVCGEVIEHVGRAGDLMESTASMLRPGGRAFFTTPNPYALWRVAQAVTGRVHENVDHVAFFAPWNIAELAERAGLQLLAFRGVHHPGGNWKIRLAQSRIVSRGLRLVPEATSETIIYEVGALEAGASRR